VPVAYEWNYGFDFYFILFEVKLLPLVDFDLHERLPACKILLLAEVISFHYIRKPYYPLTFRHIEPNVYPDVVCSPVLLRTLTIINLVIHRARGNPIFSPSRSKIRPWQERFKEGR
jgi:hypothetical protein